MFGILNSTKKDSTSFRKLTLVKFIIVYFKNEQKSETVHHISYLASQFSSGRKTVSIFHKNYRHKIFLLSIPDKSSNSSMCRVPSGCRRS